MLAQIGALVIAAVETIEGFALPAYCARCRRPATCSGRARRSGAPRPARPPTPKSASSCRRKTRRQLAGNRLLLGGSATYDADSGHALWTAPEGMPVLSWPPIADGRFYTYEGSTVTRGG